MNGASGSSPVLPRTPPSSTACGLAGSGEEGMAANSSSARLALLQVGPVMIAAFVMMAGLYAALIPHWLPYDEPAHFYYVAHLAGESGFTEASKMGPTYELHVQPPLAYLLYALVFKLVVAQDSGIQLAVLRGVSVVLGAATVYVNLCVVRRLIGRKQYRPLLLAATGALLAFNPAFLAVSATVTNDGLFDLLTALCLLLAMRLVEPPDLARTGWWLIGLGALIGLDCSTKALALPLLALPMIVVAARALLHKYTQGLGRWLMPALLVGVLCGAPAYVANQVANRDPFGSIYWHALVHAQGMRLSDLKHIVPLTFTSFWLFVTYLRDALPVKPRQLEYVPFAALSILPFIAAAGTILGHRLRSLLTPARVVAGGAVVLGVGAFLYKNLDDFSPEGRYLFGLVAPIAWSIAQSASYLSRRDERLRRAIFAAIIIFMVAYSLYAGVRYLGHAPNLFPNLYHH